jgi:hypothetical protein
MLLGQILPGRTANRTQASAGLLTIDYIITPE